MGSKGPPLQRCPGPRASFNNHDVHYPTQCQTHYQNTCLTPPPSVDVVVVLGGDTRRLEEVCGLGRAVSRTLCAFVGRAWPVGSRRRGGAAVPLLALHCSDETRAHRGRPHRSKQIRWWTPRPTGAHTAIATEKATAPCQHTLFASLFPPSLTALVGGWDPGPARFPSTSSHKVELRTVFSQLFVKGVICTGGCPPPPPNR